MSRNYMLDKRLQSSHQSGASSSSSSSSSAGADAARVALLEVKASKLNDELTAALRMNNDSMAQLIKVRLQYEQQGTLMLQQTDQVCVSRWLV